MHLFTWESAQIAKKERERKIICRLIKKIRFCNRNKWLLAVGFWNGHQSFWSWKKTTNEEISATWISKLRMVSYWNQTLYLPLYALAAGLLLNVLCRRHVWGVHLTSFCKIYHSPFCSIALFTILSFLIHFRPTFHFYTGCKLQKTKGFLPCWWGIQMEHWAKMSDLSLQSVEQFNKKKQEKL